MCSARTPAASKNCRLHSHKSTWYFSRWGPSTNSSHWDSLWNSAATGSSTSKQPLPMEGPMATSSSSGRLPNSWAMRSTMAWAMPAAVPRQPA